MQGVALHTSRKASLQMEMLFQVVKHRLNLRSSFQEFPLASSENLFPLFVVWRCQDVRPECSPYLPVERHTPVATVPNGEFGMLVHELWDSPTVMDRCGREDVGTELAVVVDAGMQLEPVMLTLPVVAGVGVAPGRPVELPPDQLADFQHGGVHEAKLRFALEESIQDVTKPRDYSVAVLEEVLVVRETREVALVVLENPVVNLADGLLLAGQEIEY
jgi:hypothetical protein